MRPYAFALGQRAEAPLPGIAMDFAFPNVDNRVFATMIFHQTGQ